jgi:hypothetical protein
MTDRSFNVAPWVILIVLAAGSLITACSESTMATPTVTQTVIPDPAVTGSTPQDGIVPFTNITREALGDNAFVNNWHPGVAIFDYDRDGDMDFYITAADGTWNKPEAPGGPNLLFRNDGDGVYTETAVEAGVDAFASHSTAPAACDINNDGFQDLYVASYGRIDDDLDYRSVDEVPGLRYSVTDRLFLNKGDGSFEDITVSAFGDAVNIRSAITVACDDVDGDGWLDLFVGNRADQDFIRFDDPRHHGQYNVLYRNNGDLTFTDVTEEAGLIGPQILMLNPEGVPIESRDPWTGELTRGYDANVRDELGNLVGDPTGQTLATLFFDHDNDGDPDLWIADDGDTLKVYRNDSSDGAIMFTPIEKEMGIDKVGSWMGFAVGDYDGDQDLDIFVTNIGFHFLLAEKPAVPSGDCAYSQQYGWGTCYHYLLRNDGVRDVPEVGTVGVFTNVASETTVKPSKAMPPASLESSNILPVWGDEKPEGLSAYDFGFGTVFFDYENDGDQDLYWLGSIGRGEGPNGEMYQGAGRMLRGDGVGSFEDITVESRLIDIQGVDYSITNPDDPDFDAEKQRMDPRFHENGKGLASCDLNGDGYVDLIGTNSNGPLFLGPQIIDFFPGPLFVWQNGGGDGHWISLRLKGRMAVDGTGSNADGVGARVFVTTDVGGESHTQVKNVLASSTFLGMSCLDLHFGMGEATNVNEISILWPSGVRQILTDTDVDQVLEIVEPAAE